MITEDYVSYEVAVLLKEKGFDEYCGQIYDNDKYLSRNLCGYINEEKANEFFSALAPTHQMAMKWLRDEKQIYVCPKLRCFFDGKRQYYKWEATILRLPSNNIIYPQPLDMCKHYESYPEAVEAALKYSLENLI